MPALFALAQSSMHLSKGACTSTGIVHPSMQATDGHCLAAWHVYSMLTASKLLVFLPHDNSALNPAGPVMVVCRYTRDCIPRFHGMVLW